MKCIDCVENKVENPDDAIGYLVDYEWVRPLCQGCYDEYAYAEGEMNLNFFHADITGVGQFTLLKEINSKLKYLNEMNKRYSDRYFAAKKLGEKWTKVQPSPYDDAMSDVPEGVVITNRHGKELLEAIKW